VDHEARRMRGGHAAHEGHDVGMFRDRFWLSLVLTIPVLVFSEMIQQWLGFRPPEPPGDELIAPLAGSAVFLYGGWPFLTGAIAEIERRRPGMMLLIGLALTVAFGASALSAVGMLDLEFWWELALLVDVMLLGHWLEMRAVGRASGALEALAALLPDLAERIRGGEVEVVDVGAGGRRRRARSLRWQGPRRRHGGRGGGGVRRIHDHGRIAPGAAPVRRPRRGRDRRDGLVGARGGDRRGG
jgi:Cu2+-exporting ATPase